MTKKIKFSQSTTTVYFNSNINVLKQMPSFANTIFITDENVYAHHSKKFGKQKTIVIKAGEAYKNQDTANYIIEQLVKHNADRQTFLVGVGGGVVTDITGYVASIYMRGIKFGFVPTTLLAMVDASIGGKNGIDVGVYKNIVGCINQPQFLIYDSSFLKTLPQAEWENGFAEIIKHACIKSSSMFTQLSQNNIAFYQKKKAALDKLIQQNALIKLKVVQADEFEHAERKLLNLGHTLGHAIENTYSLSHGQAISIGMVFACKLSQKYFGFKQTANVIQVLQQYGLPTSFNYNAAEAFNILKHDKKKTSNAINYALLQKIGKGIIHQLSFTELQTLL